jgi:hypothetical protein
MRIEFILEDLEQEHIMEIEGYDYIPPIGASVYFNDDIEYKGEIAGIDFDATVYSNYYNIEENTLIIYCRIDKNIYDLHQNIQDRIQEYNRLKYNKTKSK